MPARKDAWFVTVVGGAFLVLITLPYLWAFSSSGLDPIFGGFLFNPLDGYSYLAKMRVGYQGGWSYTLPYTLEQTPGAYLFVYYVLLGHFARLTNLPLVVTFHLARLAGAGLMILALWRFYSRVIEAGSWRRLAFALALFAAGLGWLGMALGKLTADMWVAEAYPFLSAYANPHFPMGLALMTFLLTPGSHGDSASMRPWKEALSTLFSSLNLALILPFGLVVAVVVLAGLVFWHLLDLLGLVKQGRISRQVLWYLFSGSQEFRRLWLALAGGGMVLLYYQWVVATDPLFNGWNAQNLTLSPAWWDVAFSLSPLLILAVPGAWLILRSRNREMRVLIAWAALGLLLVYLPFGLQRRFFTGLMIPLAGLGALGIHWLGTKIGTKRARLAAAVLFILAVPTTLLNLMVGAHGVQTRDALLFISTDERQALLWLAENAPQPAGVLASPQTGMLIPAFGGQRVVYGHPFETVFAMRQEALVKRLFTGNYLPEDLALLSQVAYVFYGPRERAIGEPAFLQELEPAWQEGGVTIYHSLNEPPP